MAEKYFHRILGSDTAGNGTPTSPYKTYDKARAMAGALDEVWGGGIGCSTWARIRFCAPNGNDANSGLTPDTPKQRFWDVWNANDISTSDSSLVILIKGAYIISSTRTLTKGGYRTSQSSPAAGSTKMLRGYTGSDYFGSGYCNIYVVATDGLILDLCDNSVFQNISMRDVMSSQSSRSLIAGKMGHSLYNIRFVNCEFYGIESYGIDGNRYMSGFYGSTVIGCRFVGKRTTSIGYNLSGNSEKIFYGCYFKDLQQPYYYGGGQMSLNSCIVANCSTGMEFRGNYSRIWSNLILANCGTAFRDEWSSACPVVTDSIIYNCAQLGVVNMGQPVLQNSCIWPLTDLSLKKSTGMVSDDNSLIGEGCFVADPQFVDAANDDFRLKANSPCWNKGLGNPFVAGSVGHIGVDVRPMRGNPSRAAVYANSRQMIGR